jgi:hypothetical protein
MKEAQNRSRRCLQSESDKGVVVANFIERGRDDDLCHQLRRCWHCRRRLWRTIIKVAVWW